MGSLVAGQHHFPMPSCGVHLPTCLHKHSSLHLQFLAKAVTKSLPTGSALVGLWGRGCEQGRQGRSPPLSLLEGSAGWGAASPPLPVSQRPCGEGKYDMPKSLWREQGAETNLSPSAGVGMRGVPAAPVGGRVGRGSKGCWQVSKEYLPFPRRSPHI